MCTLSVCVDIILQRKKSHGCRWTSSQSYTYCNTHTQQWKLEGEDTGWMYAKKPKRTHEHINNNKKWSCVFVFLLFICSSTLLIINCVGCLDSFHFTFSMLFLLSLYLSLLFCFFFEVFFSLKVCCCCCCCCCASNFVLHHAYGHDHSDRRQPVYCI